jgi:hypothetical protein
MICLVRKWRFRGHNLNYVNGPCQDNFYLSKVGIAAFFSLMSESFTSGETYYLKAF